MSTLDCYFLSQTKNLFSSVIMASPRRKSFVNDNGSEKGNDKGRHRRRSEHWSSNHDSNHSRDSLTEETLTEGVAINSRRAPSPHATPLSSSVGDQQTSYFKQKVQAQDDISLLPNLPKQGKAGHHRPKALINPFDPSQVTIKLTSNRRRWTHVFPLGSSGIFMQQHHYQAVPQNTANTMLPSEACLDAENQESRKVSVSQFREGLGRGQKISMSTSPRPSMNRDDRLTRNSVRAQDTHSNTMTYAWGATGEQEWTPLITTGVDWKSLVMPACLPITTDFFPDQRSLNNDYQMHDYVLLPEDQGLELLSHVCYRDGEDLRNHLPFSTQQVLEELVCQRLQQGFQLILLPRDIKDFGSKSDNNMGNLEYTLSIGRIFHNLSTTRHGNSIKVRQFKPRHPYTCMKIHYCYRFRAPDNTMYGVSWVDFTSERLENYKWNYLDNYICMRGEGEYDLQESKDLKFWRFRLLILPNICMKITERITVEISADGEKKLNCLGAYKESNHKDRMQLFLGFLKFMETLSKVKRPQKRIEQPKKPGNLGPKTPNSPQLNRGNSTPTLTQAKSPRGKNIPQIPDEFDGNICPSGTKTSQAKVEKIPLESCSFSPSKAQKIAVPENLKEIADKMKTSINCLIDQKGLMPYSFISAEAIFWSIETFEGIENESTALGLFRKMHEQGLICHCSRSRKMPFVCGLFFYFLTDSNPLDDQEVDIQMFERDWIQIEMCLKEISNTEDIPTTPAEHRWNKDFQFNRATLDLGTQTKRVEWVHLRYHSRYDPGQAFEIDMDWLVATGNQIAVQIGEWSRMANRHKLHIVPIPSDPFALPFIGRSDPLRGPIYIDLLLSCLPEDLKESRLVQFREKILSKWGFLPFYEPGKKQRQYVHVSGSMFVMIPRKSDRKELDKDNTEWRNDRHETADPHETYINKHFSGLKHSDDDERQVKIFKTGFLWSWNYMITKRWKTHATGDETFMRTVMADFRKFCINDNDRLLKFYHENFSDQSIQT